MQTARTSRTRVTTVLVATLAMLLTMAVPAFASDVRADASALCASGQAVGLQYTVDLVDRLDETTEADVRVEYKPANLGDDAYRFLDNLFLREGSGWTDSGSKGGLDFQGANAASLRVTITASDNEAPDYGGRDKVEGDVWVVTPIDLTSCPTTPPPTTPPPPPTTPPPTPAAPSAAIDSACTIDGAVVDVDVDNPTSAAVTYVVEISGVTVETFSVPADSVATRVYPVSDGTHDVVVTAGDQVVLDTVVDVVCDGDALQLSFEVACTQGVGSFVAQLSNTGAATTAQVLVDGQVVADLDVPADSTKAFTVELPTGLPQVAVVSEGATIFDVPVEVDCVAGETEEPTDPGVTPTVTPVVTHECQTPTDGIYTVTVDNPSLDPVEIVVTILDDDGVPALDDTFTLDADESSTLTAPLTDGPHVLLVTADGTEVLRENVDVDCTAVLGVTEGSDDAPVVAGAADLPAAGAATVAWVLLALLLMFFGADVVLSGELRRRLAMMRA